MKWTAMQRVSDREGAPAFAPGSGRARGGRVATRTFSADVVPEKLSPVELFPNVQKVRNERPSKQELEDHTALDTSRAGSS